MSQGYVELIGFRFSTARVPFPGEDPTVRITVFGVVRMNINTELTDNSTYTRVYEVYGFGFGVLASGRPYTQFLLALRMGAV